MLEVPMYRVNRTRVQLADLLSKVPVNNWVWSVIEFDGVGQMPFNDSVLEFQERLREQPRGLVLTWSEISSFAESIEYTIDCLVVAVSSVERLEANKLLADDFQGCEIALRAIDSTEWIIFSSNQELLDELEVVARYT
ncbi:hypothetical protein M3M50_16065 [Pseudomonas bijieensis]|uniref:hypothetical protein n=1 Tax=Pseudomonas bijieensis TaxID=2681983 RepID=UPI00200F8EA4|nr:hypothetical protein [Pseudomonas bijieensis]UQI28493.1 hypothetical protein M3M50_16065 [Pseudomonas bijieensis]